MTATATATTATTVTVTVTVQLVLNRKLHLRGRYGLARCAGRYVYGTPVTVSREVTRPAVAKDASTTERLAAMRVERDAEFALIDGDLVAAMTPEHRANLCEKCAGSVANAYDAAATR